MHYLLAPRPPVVLLLLLLLLLLCHPLLALSRRARLRGEEGQRERERGEGTTLPVGVSSSR